MCSQGVAPAELQAIFITRPLLLICAGGPTGVEVAAELHDLLQEDLKRYYGHLVTHMSKVLLVELGDHVLSSYDRAISDYTSNLFRRCAVQVQAWVACLPRPWACAAA